MFNVLPGTYSLHTDRFLYSVDLKEIRAKQVVDPYVKWPFWHQEQAISRAIRVRSTWFLHGSIALSVLLKMGFRVPIQILTQKP